MIPTGQDERVSEEAMIPCYRFWVDDADAVGEAMAKLLPPQENFALVRESGEAGPGAAHYFGLAPDDIEGAARLALVPVRTQTASESPLALIRAASRIALDLSGIAGCRAVGWTPAQSAMDPAYFRSVAGQWLQGGAFPALGLVALLEDEAGNLSTLGLATICGQELVLAAEAAPAKVERARIAIRMIDHLVSAGPMPRGEALEIDGFGMFEARPDETGKKIYLRRSPFP